MRVIASFLLLATAFGAEKLVRKPSPLLQAHKEKANLNDTATKPASNVVSTHAILSQSGKKAALSVQQPYVDLENMKDPPHGFAQIKFSANFPNGNICGESDLQQKVGSCEHNCVNNCKKSFAVCNKMYKACKKTGKWQVLTVVKKKDQGKDSPAPQQPTYADDIADEAEHSLAPGTQYGEEGGADDGSDGGLLIETSGSLSEAPDKCSCVNGFPSTVDCPKASCSSCKTGYKLEGAEGAETCGAIPGYDFGDGDGSGAGSGAGGTGGSGGSNQEAVDPQAPPSAPPTPEPTQAPDGGLIETGARSRKADLLERSSKVHSPAKKAAALKKGAEPKASKSSNIVSTHAILSQSGKKAALSVQQPYVDLENMKDPPHGFAQIKFSANFPNGNICGESDLQQKVGSCEHNCVNNCKKSFAVCNKMYKACKKTGKWQVLTVVKKKDQGKDSPAPQQPTYADDIADEAEHSLAPGTQYGEEGGADDGSDGGLIETGARSRKVLASKRISSAEANGILNGGPEEKDDGSLSKVGEIAEVPVSEVPDVGEDDTGVHSTTHEGAEDGSEGSL